MIDSNHVMDVILTQYGRKLLGQGKLVVKYYKFGDEEVNYQTPYALTITGSV